MNSKVSIIVPVYNSEHYLKKCISSILTQTYTDFELILVDDGSQDKSGAICDNYALEDTRVKVIHKENGGVSSAKNSALGSAVGKYIMFIDSDDWIEHNMLATLLCQNCSYDADLVFSGLECSFEGRPSQKYFHRAGKSGYYLIDEIHTVIMDLSKNGLLNFCVAKLFKKEIIDKNMLRFDESTSLAEDTIFMTQYIPCISNFYIDQGYYYHYEHVNPSSLSTKHKPNTYYLLSRVITLLRNMYLKLNVYNEEIEDYLLERYMVIVIGTIRGFARDQCKRSFFDKIAYLNKIFKDSSFNYLLKKADFTRIDKRLGMVANRKSSVLCVVYITLCRLRYDLKVLLGIEKK